MHYLQTENATVSYPAKGLNHTFDPVLRLGGSWLGVFTTEDDEVATKLLEHQLITEISEAEYDVLKKKQTKNGSVSLNLKPVQAAPAAPSQKEAVAEGKEDGDQDPEPNIQIAKVDPDKEPAKEPAKPKTTRKKAPVKKES